MQLVINEYGSVIKKEENRFIVVTKDQKHEFSADDVKQILITAGASISANVIKLAMSKDIDIVYANKYGEPYARIYPCRLGGTTLTRRKQATQYLSTKISEAIKNIAKSKIKNQINMLKSLSKTRENVDFSEEIKSIEAQLENLETLVGNMDDIRQQLLGIEGFSSSQYFSCLSRILPFSERQHEAKDPFNAMLNYAYGIMYSEVEKSCIIAGLDPYLGFMHTDRYGKPSLVLDFIEQFRQPIADRAVINLFARKQIEDSDFESSGNVFMLSERGKEKLINEVMELLNRTIKYKNKNLPWKAVIMERAREFVRLLLEGEYYGEFSA
ncbi:MAG: CRISPR-associated endonuclease Cas1 [Candidatus Aenigmarchaeota archaeon]|nr:CRISPR-associated endonuclease Cas1 [Candidatus Aenigmarchaeota archaeon]